MEDEDLVHLLESGASATDAKDVLLKSIVTKNAKLVKLLLKYKVPSNFTFSFEEMKDFNYSSMEYPICSSEGGYTPLHLAVMVSNLEIVEALLKEGSIVDTCSEVELPLHLAVERNDEEIISKLVEYGACIDSKCSLGLTPLCHAVFDFKTKAFKSLVKLGASLRVENSTGFSLLHFADYENDMKTKMIKLALECGADANSKGPTNISAFQKVICCRAFHFDDMFYDPDKLLTLFLEEGFDLNTQIVGTDQLLLHFVALIGNAQVVDLLLQHNIDVNLLDDKRRTAFHYAVENASMSVDYIWANLHRNPPNRGLDAEDCYYQTDCYWLMSGVNDCAPRVEVARSLTQALAKIQASGEDLNPEDLTLMKNEFVQYYYNRCNEELELLKQSKITKHVTYFDILIANENRLADYANNENIIKAFEYENLDEFSLYRLELKARFERGVARKKLFEMSKNILNEGLKIKVPMLVIDELFKYLRCVDLKNLCRARNPLIFVSSEFFNDN